MGLDRKHSRVVARQRDTACTFVTNDHVEADDPIRGEKRSQNRAQRRVNVNDRPANERLIAIKKTRAREERRTTPQRRFTGDRQLNALRFSVRS